FLPRVGLCIGFNGHRPVKSRNNEFSSVHDSSLFRPQGGLKQAPLRATDVCIRVFRTGIYLFLIIESDAVSCAHYPPQISAFARNRRAFSAFGRASCFASRQGAASGTAARLPFK